MTYSLSFAVLVMLAGSAYPAEQYKKLGRDAIADIVDGNVDKARKHFDDYLTAYPGDLEAYYGLAIVYAQKGDIAKAMNYVQKALDEGLPFDRFIAGPRDLLKPLTESAEFKALLKKHGMKLLHGPLLGCVTENSAKFWVRTAGETALAVRVGESGTTKFPIESASINTRQDYDFTAVASVTGLKSNTRYDYRILLDGKQQAGQWSFRTHPVERSKTAFQIGFGGGAGYTPRYERMWNTIASHPLQAFLLLGDNVYIDHPTRPDVQRYCYYRRQSRPEFRRFTASTSVYAVWDDHDFTTNDSWGGPDIDKPDWKIPVWRIFKNNWNNPSYGGGETQPGCWFSFSIGDVDFIMLDSRYYRTDPKVKHPSMLGRVQKEWLLKTLKASKATFKILASPVPWAYGAKPGSLDPWQGYKQEREEIFSLIDKKRIDGVVLISADRHRSDAWRIERTDGYPLYEFESSRISNIHTHRLMPGALLGYNEKCSFGKLLFDTTLPDPELSYEIFNIDNQLIHKLTLKKSQISHKREKNN